MLQNGMLQNDTLHKGKLQNGMLYNGTLQSKILLNGTCHKMVHNKMKQMYGMLHNCSQMLWYVPRIVHYRTLCYTILKNGIIHKIALNW
jgi:hypothetical protein